MTVFLKEKILYGLEVVSARRIATDFSTLHQYKCGGGQRGFLELISTL